MTQAPALTSHDHAALRAGFRWNLPARLNMARQASTEWAEAEPDRPAILDWWPDRVTTTSYGALDAMADRLAHALRKGFEAGEALAKELRTTRGCIARRIPTRLVAAFLDVLPMTVTGEVMRRELRKMAEAQG